MTNFVFSVCSRLTIIGGAITFGLAGPAVHSAAVAKEVPIRLHAPSSRVTLNVNYDDLDLSSAAGQRTLDRRMEEAVSSFCVGVTGGYDGTMDADFAMRNCRTSTLARARPQVEGAVNRDKAPTGPIPTAAATITIAAPK